MKNVLSKGVLKAKVLKHIKSLEGRKEYLEKQWIKRAYERGDPEDKGYKHNLTKYKLENDAKLIDNIAIVIRRDPAQLGFITNGIKKNVPLENIQMGFLNEKNVVELADVMFPYTQEGNNREINKELNKFAKNIHGFKQKEGLVPKKRDAVFFQYLLFKEKIRNTLVHRELKKMPHAPAQLTDLIELTKLMKQAPKEFRLTGRFGKPGSYFTKKEVRTHIERLKK